MKWVELSDMFRVEFELFDMFRDEYENQMSRFWVINMVWVESEIFRIKVDEQISWVIVVIDILKGYAYNP